MQLVAFRIKQGHVPSSDKNWEDGQSTFCCCVKVSWSKFEVPSRQADFTGNRNFLVPTSINTCDEYLQHGYCIDLYCTTLPYSAGYSFLPLTLYLNPMSSNSCLLSLKLFPLLMCCTRFPNLISDMPIKIGRWKERKKYVRGVFEENERMT